MIHPNPNIDYSDWGKNDPLQQNWDRPPGLSANFDLRQGASVIWKGAIEGLTADLSRGGHSSHAALRRDMEKGNAAVAQGWRVLRFEQAAVDSGQALEMIRTIVAGQR